MEQDIMYHSVPKLNKEFHMANHVLQTQ